LAARDGRQPGRESLSPGAGADLSISPPGCEGPRSCLGFVLKVLEGNDAGVIQQEICTAQRMCQEKPDALEKLTANSDLIRIAERGMVTLMRQLVDLWIDSGKSFTDRDVDSPSARNVFDIPPGHSWQLSQLIYAEFLNVNPQWAEIRRDGTIGTIDLPPRFDSAVLEGTDWYDPLNRFGRQVAHYWFLKLLNSPYSRHIARCDDCGSYFAYDRARKRTVNHGVHCSECKGQGSVKRTELVRQKALEKRVGLAAEAWKQWPGMQAGPRTKWVAYEVRKKSAQKIVFTSNWVTRHQAEIEAEVQRRNHAKG